MKNFRMKVWRRLEHDGIGLKLGKAPVSIPERV